MRIEKRDNNIYTKSLSEMEGYLLNIVKRFFEKEHDSVWESREAIINESVRRAKEEILLLSSLVISVNGETGEVILDCDDIGAEPKFSKNTAFNKNFGTLKGTVCEGNDPRLDKTDLYTKEEIDDLIDDIKKLTAGIKFNIFKEDWHLEEDSYVATLNHNLNLNIESFSISFYKNGESCSLDHKIISSNTVKIYSDEASDITIAIKQSITATVAIPSDIRDLIENTAKMSEENKLDVSKIKESNTEIVSTIGTLLEATSSNSDAIKVNASNITINSSSIADILDRLDNFASINHEHNIDDITGLKKYIDDEIIHDYGEIDSSNNKRLKLKRGNDASFIIYCGELGEVIVNTETKTLHVMDGTTPGGVALAKKNHNHSYNELSDLPVIDLSGYFTKEETYNREEIERLISEIDISQGLIQYYTKEEVDILIKKINEMEEIILPGETLTDGNITYRVKNLEREIKELKREIYISQKYDVLEANWVLNETTNLYEYNLNHNEEIEMQDIIISFYVDNKPYMFNYEFVDINNIKITTRTVTDLLIVFKVKTGIRNEIVEGGEDNDMS